MAGEICLPLALALALSPALLGVASWSKCVLSGQWQNKPSSQMHIFDVEVDGSFSGKYRMAVSATQAPIWPVLLCRCQQLHGEGQQPTFSFTVTWKSFSDSTTVFVGQCFVDKSREESLHTMWLLREEVNSEKDGWKATGGIKGVMQRSQAQAPATEIHQTHLQLQLPAMMQSIGFIMVLALAGVTLGIPLNYKCSLVGQWQNDLGSEMNISAVSSAGNFFGMYLTKVSATHKPIAVSPLSGSQQMGDLKQPTFGFTVTWSFTHSTTVFVGQCFVDDKGKETLQTMWLLREEVDSIKDNWKATLVGTNNFTRLQS